MNKGLFTSQTDNWETPQVFFDLKLPLRYGNSSNLGVSEDPKKSI